MTSKFERIILKCFIFLFGRWLSKELLEEINNMLEPKNFMPCDMTNLNEMDDEEDRLLALKNKEKVFALEEIEEK